MKKHFWKKFPLNFLYTLPYSNSSKNAKLRKSNFFFFRVLIDATPPFYMSQLHVFFFLWVLEAFLYSQKSFFFFIFFLLFDLEKFWKICRSLEKSWVPWFLTCLYSVLPYGLSKTLHKSCNRANFWRKKWVFKKSTFWDHAHIWKKKKKCV